MLRELAREFEGSNSDCRIAVPDSVGSRGGIRALRADKATIARVSRPLKDSEQSEDLVYVPMAETTVGFVVHPSVLGVDALSTEQLLAIYSGKIGNWAEVGGPNHAIYPLIRDGGTTLSRVVDSIPGFGEQSAAKDTYSSLETKRLLLKHPYTLGFLPMTLAVDAPLRPIRIVDDSDGSTIDISLTLGLVRKTSMMACEQRFFDFLVFPAAQQIIERNLSRPLLGR